ncbi:hypothetical protein V8D89_007274 [Ganoderma adspersum]
MLRGAAGRSLKVQPGLQLGFSGTRRLHSQTVQGARHINSAWTLTSLAAAIAAGAAWYTTTQGVVIHNDAPSESPEAKAKVANTLVNALDEAELSTLVWGSNQTHVLDDQLPQSVRVPSNSEWFKNVALRDLALHEKHAACVDAKGDVYQWGDGFFGGEPGSSHARPQITLKGKNITQLQVTRSQVYALSSSGCVYVLSSCQNEQTIGQTPASTTWWSTGWIWGEADQVDFAELTPNDKLKRGERFVQISAGSDHLLALTSNGRTFAHPITLNANSHGQLGFRKCDVPSPADLKHVHQPHQQRPRVHLELTPKSLVDPYAKSAPAVRPTAAAVRNPEALIGREAAIAGVDDTSIRWSDRLFEVPALKDVKVDRVAAGARSSFVKTPNGRVLGWGANDFGQIGLGPNVALDAITVPTEVNLWRTTPGSMKTTCRNIFAGGDLTIFEVERADGGSMPYTDVLSCGNGQYGGLGNAQYSNAQFVPVRAKAVSGLLEYSEKTKSLQAIVPQAISVSPTGHVLLTLDTRTRAGPGGGGRDVVVWGSNFDYQLGTGKRGSVATPTTLECGDGERFMLQTKKAEEVRDMQGKVWKKGIEVEQRAVAGWGNSVVYWRIC